MHARELLELGALLAAHGRAVVNYPHALDPSGMQGYWAASKCRLDRWTRHLRALSHRLQTVGKRPLGDEWLAVRPVMEEIISGELLTRVWAALVTAHDRRRGVVESEPIVRSVFLGHLEARRRALDLLVLGQGVGVQEAVRLNRLRRCVERWNDLAFAQLMEQIGVEQFAFDPRRASDFREQVERGRHHVVAPQGWPLLLAALRLAFHGQLDPSAPNADLNQQLANHLLECLPNTLFDTNGLFKTLWVERFYQAESDSRGMLDTLIDTVHPVTRFQRL